MDLFHVIVGCVSIFTLIGLTVIGKMLAIRLDAIHVLVNSRLSAALLKIEQLETKLGLPSSEN